MRLPNLILIALVHLGLLVQAQKKPIVFTARVQAGLLEGEAGGAFHLSASGGLTKKTWSASVGTGLDYYHTRSIPLFADVRKTLRDHPRTAFVYLSGGYHFPWLRADQKMFEGVKTRGGVYADAGLGYQFPVFKTQQLFFTLGYSQKRMSQWDSPMYISIWPAPPQGHQRVNYVLNRITIKTGLRL